MKIRTIVASLLLGFSGLASMGQTHSSPVSPERVILDDILAEMNLPKITRHIGIMEKFGKFYLDPREQTEKFYPATVAEKNLGFVYFSRPSDHPIFYNSQPRKKEVLAPISIIGARNSTALACFGILPQNELAEVTVSISDLKNAQGAILLRREMDLYWIQHLMESISDSMFQPHPIGYRPLQGQPITLRQGMSYGFAIDIHLGADVTPGIYRGTITVRADGKEAVKPITLQVHDFELLQPDTKRMNWGFWYAGVEQNKGNQQAIRKDLEFMARFGVTFLVLPARVEPDYFEYIQTIRKMGITGPLFIDFVMLEQRIENPKANVGNSIWRTEYKSLVKQFVEQMRLIGEDENSYIAMIGDEPRETLLEPWNRTFSQTLIYYKLIGKAAPHLRRAVNPMDDLVCENFSTGMYALFSQLFEVIMPHYWARSRNTIDAAHRDPDCEVLSKIL